MLKLQEINCLKNSKIAKEIFFNFSLIPNYNIINQMKCIYGFEKKTATNLTNLAKAYRIVKNYIGYFEYCIPFISNFFFFE